MLWKIYSIFDSKVGAYGRPFFDHSKGAVIRSVSEAVNDKTNVYGKYPADFTLFELGDFDEHTCEFSLYAAPVSVGVLLEFVTSGS